MYRSDRKQTGPRKTPRNYQRVSGRLLDEEGSVIKQGQAYRRGLSIDELSEAYEKDALELDAEEMIVEWGTARPAFLDDGYVSSYHLRSPLCRDTRYGFELTPQSTGSTDVWYMRAPKSMMRRANQALIDGDGIDMDEIGAFAWPSVGDQLQVERIYAADRIHVSAVTVTVSEIAQIGNLTGCVKVVFDVPIDSRRITESRRGTARSRARRAR